MPGPVPSPTVFALLDAEWATLARTLVPACWHDQPALAPHRTLADLLQVTERRGDPAQSDHVLAALEGLAAQSANPHPLAGRTLLQMLLPGAKALARRLAWLGDPAERAQAQEVSLDALVALGEPAVPPAAAVDPSPAEALLGLLAWAVNGGHLTPAQARLIGQSRIADVPCQQLGAGVGLGAHSLRRRRQRAEHALAQAASGALAEEDLSALVRRGSRPDRVSRRSCLIYRDALL